MKTIAKWDIEDYHRLIETGILGDRHLELLQGEIWEMSPEGPLHTYVTEGLGNYLRSLLENRAVVREAHPITLSDSEPQPDLAIVQPPRQRYRERHPYPEDIFWLVETSQSTVDYDLNDKKKIYARAKIGEYWVVDVNQNRIHIFREPQGEDYQVKSIVVRGTITPQAFSNLRVSVDRFWD